MRLPAAAGAPAVLVVVSLLAGCTGAGPGPAGAGDPAAVTTPDTHVDVDTRELRAQKAGAGIENCVAGGTPVEAEDALPALELPCLGGGPAVNLNGLRGPLVINLFAQWCAPCREELPYYQRLHEEAPGGVRVLGIDFQDTQPGGALALAQESGVTYPLLADPDGALRTEFRIRGLPGAVLVDAEGRITRIEFAVIDSYDELTGLVDTYL